MGTRGAPTEHLRETLANEFWGHIQARLERMVGATWRANGADDDLQSAVTSILLGQEGLVFHTEAQFLTYLAKRMSWKRSARMRRLAPQVLDGVSPPLESGPGPATHTELGLDAQTLLGRARALAPEQGYVLFARLDGVPLTEQAEHLGISPSSCRRLYLRAIESLGRLNPGS